MNSYILSIVKLEQPEIKRRLCSNDANIFSALIRLYLLQEFQIRLNISDILTFNWKNQEYPIHHHRTILMVTV